MTRRKQKDVVIIGVNLTTTSMGVRLDDGAAALVIEGVPIVAIAEERLTRDKHCGGVARSVHYCLSTAGITLADVDWIAVSICCDIPPSPMATSEFLAREGLEVAPDRILVCPSHHLSHAASSFFASPFEKALAIVADSEGTVLGQRSHPDYWRNRLERTTVWLCRSWNGHHSFERLMSHGDQAGEGSIGSTYNSFTKWLGFKNYHEAGQTMALAAFAENHQQAMSPFVWEGDRLVSRVRLNYQDKTQPVRDWYLEVLGRDIGPRQDGCWEPSDLQVEVAAVIQTGTEEALLEIARRAMSMTGIRNLCLSGGVALNCVANSRLGRESGAAALFVQPAASDVGQCLGNALWAYHSVLGKSRGWQMSSASLGRTYSEEVIAKAIDDYGAGIRAIQYQDPAEAAAHLIASGSIVGWFQGGSELGPRALGHRSILGDPRTLETKVRLDARVKRREPFRPYAPSVSAVAAPLWFDLSETEIQVPSSPIHFMLEAVEVRQEARGRVPAIVHADGSARVHVVRSEVNLCLHQLIDHFERLTGVPVVLNTSFNAAGRPIVETPGDALDSLRDLNLDAIVIGKWIVTATDF